MYTNPRTVGIFHPLFVVKNDFDRSFLKIQKEQTLGGHDSMLWQDRFISGNPIVYVMFVVVVIYLLKVTW